MSNKQTIQELDDAVQLYHRKAEEVAQAQEDLFQGTADLNLMALGTLLKQLNTGLNTLFEGMAGTEHFDKKLGEQLSKAITDAINAFTKVKHEINFEPTINVDLKPLEAELNRSTAQSKLLQGLVEKFSNGTGKQEELFRLIMLIGERQVAAFEKINNMADIRPELEKINATLNSRPTDFDIKVTKRDDVRGFLQEATIKAKAIK